MKMTNQEALPIFERDNTITPRKLRAIGYIPATVYGKNTPSFSIQIKTHEFQLALARGVRNFRLEGMGQTIDAEVKQLQKVSTREEVLHVEFHVPVGQAAKAPKAQPAAAAVSAPEEVLV